MVGVRKVWRRADASRGPQGSVSLPASFLSGAFAGTLATLLTHPFDVAKTRIQVVRLPGDGGYSLLSVISLSQLALPVGLQGLGCGGF